MQNAFNLCYKSAIAYCEFMDNSIPHTGYQATQDKDIVYRLLKGCTFLKSKYLECKQQCANKAKK